MYINTMIPVIQRFLSKIVIDKEGCWEWTNSLSLKGYPQFGVNYKNLKAHRFIYEYYHGAICPDLTIDHLCRNRKCVNPAHLEQVTNRENILRGIGVTATNSRKTHCKRGHQFTPENTYLTLRGRSCRTCKDECTKLWQQNNQIRYKLYAKNWRQRN